MYSGMEVMSSVVIVAFECVLEGKPIVVPGEISGSFVRHAEEIAEISYSQSETFSSVSCGGIGFSVLHCNHYFSYYNLIHFECPYLSLSQEPQQWLSS